MIAFYVLPSIKLLDSLRGLGIFVLIMLHVVVLGYWIVRKLGFHASDFSAQTCVRLAAGFAMLGGELLVLGHLQLLTTLVLAISSAVTGVAFIALLPRVLSWTRNVGIELRSLYREDRLLALSAGAMLGCVFIAGARTGFWTDEMEYHYAAPLYWANHGGWAVSPYHNTNGPALAEVLYTFNAVLEPGVTDYHYDPKLTHQDVQLRPGIAAHWTHATFLLILVAGVAGMARRAGGSAVAAVAACLAVPAIVNQAPIAYSDVAAAGFAMAGYVALYCERRRPASDPPKVRPPHRYGTIALAAILLSAATSVKAYGLYLLPVACLYVAWPLLLKGLSIPERMVWVRRGVVLAVPVLLIFGFWTIRSYVMTGSFWFREIEGLTAHSADDPMWLDGEHVARVPTIRDLAMLPIVPVTATVLGQREPYGGRTGVVLLIFVPVGIYAIRRLPQPQQAVAWWVLAAAAGFFFGLGPTGVKTRYHGFAWASLTVVVGVGFSLLKAHRSRPAAKIGLATFYVLTWLCMADVLHVILKHVTPYYPGLFGSA